MAIDCVALFSSTVKSFAMPAVAMLRNIANDSSTDVSPTPMPMPVLARMYSAVAARMPPRRKPVTAERSVSWAMSPR